MYLRDLQKKLGGEAIHTWRQRVRSNANGRPTMVHNRHAVGFARVGDACINVHRFGAARLIPPALRSTIEGSTARQSLTVAITWSECISIWRSSREAIRCIESEGGEVIAAAALVDRSAGSVDLGIPFFPLIAINFPTYAADELPDELAAKPAVKPGSRVKP